MSGSSVFTEGGVLRFELDGFSHYDDADVYQFHSQSDGQKSFGGSFRRIWTSSDRKLIGTNTSKLWMPSPVSG